MPRLKDTIVYCYDDCGAWNRYRKDCRLASGVSFKCSGIEKKNWKRESHLYLTHYCQGVAGDRTCTVCTRPRYRPQINNNDETYTRLETNLAYSDNRTTPAMGNGRAMPMFEEHSDDYYYDDDEEVQDEF